MNGFTWGALKDADCNIWLPILNTNIIIKGDEKNNYKYVGKLLSENSLFTNNCIIKALETQTDIILFARESYEAWKIDKKLLCISYIKYSAQARTRVADVVRIGDYAIILPVSSKNSILIFNLYTYKTKKVLWKNNIYGEHTNFIRGFCENMCVYTATRNLGKIQICKVDVLNCIAELYVIDVRMVNAISSEGDNLWIFGLDNDNNTFLGKYSRNTKSIVEKYVLDNIEPISESGSLGYFKMEICKGKIYFIPALAKKIYVYDIAKKLGEHMEFPEKIKNSRINNNLSFLEIQRIDDNLYMFPCAFPQILKMDMLQGSIEAIELNIEKSVGKKVLDDCTGMSQILNEDYPLTLKDFIKDV